jgi:hypothetical protein
MVVWKDVRAPQHASAHEAAATRTRAVRDMTTPTWLSPPTRCARHTHLKVERMALETLRQRLVVLAHRAHRALPSKPVVVRSRTSRRDHVTIIVAVVVIVAILLDPQSGAANAFHAQTRARRRRGLLRHHSLDSLGRAGGALSNRGDPERQLLQLLGGR